MNCPYCGRQESRVMDSRSVSEGVRRRRICLACNKRFTTYERIQPHDIFVIKKDGRREDFSRDKLLVGIRKACEKRPISMESMEKIVEDVEQACQEFQAKEIPSSVIGEKVMTELKALDGVAYVRFASVYRQFRDVGEFMSELKDLLSKGKK